MLPAPVKTLLPTVNIATAIGWPEGGMPQASPGTQVNISPAISIIQGGSTCCQTVTCW